jgi:hypothetical protein
MKGPSIDGTMKNWDAASAISVMKDVIVVVKLKQIRDVRPEEGINVKVVFKTRARVVRKEKRRFLLFGAV